MLVHLQSCAHFITKPTIHLTEQLHNLTHSTEVYCFAIDMNTVSIDQEQHGITTQKITDQSHM